MEDREFIPEEELFRLEKLDECKAALEHGWAYSIELRGVHYHVLERGQNADGRWGFWLERAD
jgi:hypothetical protein